MKSNHVRIGIFVVGSALLITQFINCGATGSYGGSDLATTQNLQPGSVGLSVITSTAGNGFESMALLKTTTSGNSGTVVAATGVNNTVPPAGITTSSTSQTIAQSSISISGVCNPGDNINQDICISWQSCEVFYASGSYIDVTTSNIGLTTFTSQSVGDSGIAPPATGLFRTSSTTAACASSAFQTAKCIDGRFTATIAPPVIGQQVAVYPQSPSAAAAAGWGAPPQVGEQIGSCVLDFNLNGNDAPITVDMY